MADSLGVDLPVTDLGISEGGTRGPADPAPQGWNRDSLGNLYRDPSQGRSNQSDAGGSAGDRAGQQGTAGERSDGQAGTTPPSVDPAIVAAQAEARAAREYVARYEAANAAREAQREEASWRAYYKTLPKDQQPLAARERQVELAARQVQQAITVHQTQQAQNEPFYRGVAVNMLVEQYGAKTGLDDKTFRGILEKQAGPEQMEAIAQALSSLSRDARLTQRVQAGTDAAATTAPGTTRPTSAPTWKQQSLRDQLSAAFAGSTN